jgi:8-amino-7-oxononanoate synthase
MSSDSFQQELAGELEVLRSQNLLRQLRRIDSPQGAEIRFADRAFINFSSNDYLGLANDGRLKEAAIRAVEQFGAGSGSARLICGSLGPLHAVEEAFAQMTRTPAALAFSTGYSAALGVITALLTSTDFAVLDKRVHASMVDAVRLSGAQIRVFHHNDMNDLEKILRWARNKPTDSAQKRSPRILILTESIFSMDGDCAPLAEILALKDQYGAWLLLDEAHAFGLFGEHRTGLGEAFASRIEVRMATLGKAVGASGGIVCGCRELIDLLINRARSFIFSTAPVPAAAAAALAGLKIIASPEGATLVDHLRRTINRLHSMLAQVGQLQPLHPQSSGILPLVLGEESRALAVAQQLLSEGIFVPAVRYPTVARGQARLRFTASAAHNEVHFSQLQNALAKWRDHSLAAS